MLVNKCAWRLSPAFSRIGLSLALIFSITSCQTVGLPLPDLITPLPAWGQSHSAQMIFEPGYSVGSASQGPTSHATYKYEGNLFSRKFHQPNCPYTLVMSPARKVYFGARKLAMAEGYKACRFCLPAASCTVHACLVKQEENQAEQ